MRKLHAHPVRLTFAAFGLAAAVVVGIAAATGFGTFARAWSHLDFTWLVLTAAASC